MPWIDLRSGLGTWEHCIHPYHHIRSKRDLQARRRFKTILVTFWAISLRPWKIVSAPLRIQAAYPYYLNSSFSSKCIGSSIHINNRIAKAIMEAAEAFESPELSDEADSQTSDFSNVPDEFDSIKSLLREISQTLKSLFRVAILVRNTKPKDRFQRALQLSHPAQHLGY